MNRSMAGKKEALEKDLNEELHGSIDFEVVDVSEGQLVRLKDGTLIDPEIFVSYFSDLSAFEEEFGPLHEAREKLRELKKLEEEFGPVSELSESLNRLYEQAERLLESNHYADDDDYEEYPEDEELGDEDEEEYDVSELTVKQLLALLLAALVDEDDGADDDVDLEDLDLERVGNMTVGELLQLIREGKVEEVSEGSRGGGCGCGDKKGNKKNYQESYDLNEIVDKLFEEVEEGGLDSQPTLGMVEEPNVEREGEDDDENEVEKEEDQEKQDQEDQAVQVKTMESFDLDIFKRLLERIG